MAVLDTAYLILGVISGAHVPPVLTVILVQTTIPLTAWYVPIVARVFRFRRSSSRSFAKTLTSLLFFEPRRRLSSFTQCVHPDGRCARRTVRDGRESSLPNRPHDAPKLGALSDSTLDDVLRANHVSHLPDVSSVPNLPPPPPPPVRGWGGLSRHHIVGTGLIFLAILIGLTPAVLSLDNIDINKKDARPDRTAYNTIVFCLAAVPAAVSQLHKEHALTRARRPVDRNRLNAILSVFQLLFALVVSPLAYGLQGMGDGPGWTELYPSERIGENFSHGMACFAGTLDEGTMKRGYPEEADCRWAWSLVLLHVSSIVMVGVAIDKLAAATKVMYRGVSMGIMLAVLFMFVYQIRDEWCEYGMLVNIFHFTSTVVLMVGAEIYHGVILADGTFETAYPEVGDLYDEEE